MSEQNCTGNEWDRLSCQLVDDARGIGLWCSSVSLGCSFLLCVLYWYYAGTRRTPGWLIFRATLCDMVVSACLVSICAHDDLRDILKEAGTKQVMRFATVVIAFFEVMAAALRTFMYMYLLSIYRNPFQPERHRYKYPAFVLASATAGAVFVGAVRNEDVIKLAVGLFALPFFVFVGLGGAVYAGVRTLVVCNRRSVEASVISGHSNFIPKLAKQRVSRHGLAYFALFGVQLTLGLAAAIALWAQVARSAKEGGAAPYGWRWLRQVTVCLGTVRPACTFVGWFFINDVAYKVCGCCSIKRFRERRHSNMEDLPATVQLQRRQRDNHSKMVQGIKESGFKEELRFELVLEVARGLGELAHWELHGIASTARPAAPALHSGLPGRLQTNSFHIELVPTNGTDLTDQGQGGPDEDPQQALSFHAGAGARVNRSRTAPRGAAAGAPGQRHRQQLLGTDGKEGGSGYLQLANSRGRHYEPTDFLQIRKAFRISAVTYAASFPNALTANSKDWQSKFRESVSEGVSGCFFYRVFGGGADSESSRFIVKQITKTEKDTLMRILPAYMDYVKRRSGRSLIQYFGCHSMPLSWTFSRKVYFVVMRNFLPEKMWLIFDLKGATMKRRALAQDSLYNKKAKENTKAKQRGYGTLRDWEWLDIAMAVDVSAKDRAELADMIAADASFLGEHGLLDYSLLLGVHRCPPNMTPQQRQTHLERCKKVGGFVSLDRQKVYFFGIIDVLEQYTFRWKVQHAVLKAACVLTFNQWSDSDGISAMPPVDYADRFRTFLLREVLQCDRREGSSGADEGTRWVRLWENRQRGLVRERIEAETADHISNMEELEHQAAGYKQRIEELERCLRERAAEPASPTAPAAPPAAVGGPVAYDDSEVSF